MAASREEIIRALRPEDEGRAQQMGALLDLLQGAGWENLHPALKSWVVNATFGPMLKHPFAYLTALGDNGEMVGQANRFYEWKIKVRREYLNERDWFGYLCAWERPYRMAVLERLWNRKRISIDELRDILIDTWTDTECPQRNQEIPVMLFHAAGFLSDDPERWEDLSDEITLYRGVDGELELTADGPSWTLNLKTARFFAYRYGAEGTVYRYTAKKSEALAFIAGRGEEEILLDFDGDSDADRIETEETHGR